MMKLRHRLKVGIMVQLTYAAFSMFAVFLVCGLCGLLAISSGRPEDMYPGKIALLIAALSFAVFSSTPWLKNKTEKMHERYMRGGK